MSEDLLPVLPSAEALHRNWRFWLFAWTSHPAQRGTKQEVVSVRPQMVVGLMGQVRAMRSFPFFLLFTLG